MGLAAKRKEIEYLEQEYNSLYMEYGKFEKEKSSYSYEVKRYHDLIKPAEERVGRHAEQFIEVGISKDESSSSSSDEEEVKRGSSGHGGTTTKTSSSYSYKSH